MWERLPAAICTIGVRAIRGCLQPVGLTPRRGSRSHIVVNAYSLISGCWSLVAGNKRYKVYGVRFKVDRSDARATGRRYAMYAMRFVYNSTFRIPNSEFKSLWFLTPDTYILSSDP